MPRPDVIVFDLGKVLVDFDYRIAARRIAARSRVPIEAVRKCLDQGTLILRYETGEIDTAGFFRLVVDGTGFNGTFEEFSKFFADIFTPIDTMIDLHAQLRQLGFPTCIFSNTNDLAIRHIQEQFPFYSLFTNHILSYEHGAMKPQSKLYEVVESSTKCKGPSILYLDDRPENIEAGRARDWQVILQESPARTVEQVQNLGLL